MSVEIVQFKKLEKNTLRGFLTVRLTSVGLEVRDICLHEKNGKRWLQLPSKPYEKKGGGQAWAYILEFYEKEKADLFQTSTLKALEQFRGQHGS